MRWGLECGWLHSRPAVPGQDEPARARAGPGGEAYREGPHKPVKQDREMAMSADFGLASEDKPRRDAQVTIELVTRARDGDRQAWDALVDRYAPLIWAICRRYQLDQADAENVAQIIWLRLLEQLEKIRDRAALAGWRPPPPSGNASRSCGTRRPQPASYVPDARRRSR